MKTELPKLEYRIPQGYCELPSTATLRKGDLKPDPTGTLWEPTSQPGQTLASMIAMGVRGPYIRKLPEKDQPLPKGFRKVKKGARLRPKDLYQHAETGWAETEWAGERVSGLDLYIRPI